MSAYRLSPELRKGAVLPSASVRRYGWQGRAWGIARAQGGSGIPAAFLIFRRCIGVREYIASLCFRQRASAAALPIGVVGRGISFFMAGVKRGVDGRGFKGRFDPGDAGAQSVRKACNGHSGSSLKPLYSTLETSRQGL
jgi:hypothetical protein